MATLLLGVAASACPAGRASRTRSTEVTGPRPDRGLR